MDDTERNGRIKEAQINNALGVFILTFGVIVLFAMIYTETFIQHMTDMAAGLLLISIGGGMVWKARRTLRKLNKVHTNQEDING